MKAIVAFCLLAVFCTVQVSAYDPLQQLKYQLDRAKSNVDSIVSDLKRSKNLLSMNTQSKLSSLSSQSISNANNIVNSALKDIRAIVDAAKAEGKDVENCYTTAKNSLSSVTQTAFQDVRKCENDGVKLLQEQLDTFDTAVAVGNKYTSELNNIFPSCYSSNIYQMQSCIAIRLGTVNSSLRTYENDVTTLKRKADSGANQAYISANSCSFQAVSTARSTNTDIRIAANRCISN